MRIRDIHFNNNIFLAPMAGVTDMAFRGLCKEQGCALVYTEMVSAKGLFYDNENTKELLAVSAREHPVAVQIFGREPELMAEMAKKLCGYDIELIDINMGCPAPKIVKNGEGSALMLEPELIGKIVFAVSNASNKPVTVKIRKGFDDGCINAVEVAKIAEKSGAAAITVHGRTREQYYGGSADWDIIAKVKQSVRIPVIGNGDVVSGDSAAKMLAHTGCDAVMIGRGALGNPWIFNEVLSFLEKGESAKPPPYGEKIETALRHCRMLVANKGEYIGVREMRKQLGWYIKGMDGAAKLRTEINRTESLAGLENLLDSIR